MCGPSASSVFVCFCVFKKVKGPQHTSTKNLLPFAESLPFQRFALGLAPSPGRAFTHPARENNNHPIRKTKCIGSSLRFGYTTPIRPHRTPGDWERPQTSWRPSSCSALANVGRCPYLTGPVLDPRDSDQKTGPRPIPLVAKHGA